MADLTMRIDWTSVGGLPSRNFICGYCGNDVAVAVGYVGTAQNQTHPKIYICHHCRRPTFFDYDGTQTPGASFGNAVSDVDDAGIAALYSEARNAIGANSPTAAVLCCRKILMHIAVNRGAEKNQTFKSYVEFLANNHHIPQGAKVWVDHIKDKGNEANHEIALSTPDDAKELVSFVEMLLKVMFEYPAIANRRAKQR